MAVQHDIPMSMASVESARLGTTAGPIVQWAAQLGKRESKSGPSQAQVKRIHLVWRPARLSFRVGELGEPPSGRPAPAAAALGSAESPRLMTLDRVFSTRRIVVGHVASALSKYGLVTPRIAQGCRSECLTYSWQSVSWIVK